MQLALLGDPVAHSLSPLIHAAALEAAGIAGTYSSRRVDAAGVADAIQELRDGRLNGVNVTMPHKSLASDLCDRLSGDAAQARSVNTLVLRDGDVHGETTDVGAIRSLWGALPAGPVLVLGAGGAAAAAVIALEGRELFLSARRTDSAYAMLSSLKVAASVVEWGRGIARAVVVNATPLGMEGESLPERVLSESSGLFDMAYGLAPTPSVSQMSESGLPWVDGRRMLVAQAALSFEIWTGQSASRAAMSAAVI